MPQVSVIITCYNNRPFIEEAIQSVVDQKVSTEIIVVDDCSTDDSWEFLQSIQPKYNFILKHPKENLGMAGARNFGFQFAIGEFINFLDGDDYFLPDKLITQTAYLTSHPGVGACYTNSKLLVEDKLVDFTLKDVWTPQSGDVFTPLLSGNFIAIHAALIRRELLSSAPFDTNKRHAADYDFWLQFARHNQVDFIDKALVVYRRTGKTNTVLQRLPLIEETIGILNRLQEQNLGSEQNKKLDIHLSQSYVARADYHLSHNKPSAGYTDLARANELAPLTGKRQIIFRTMTFNRTSGLILYRLGKMASGLKNWLEKLFGKERRFI